MSEDAVERMARGLLDVNIEISGYPPGKFSESFANKLAQAAIAAMPSPEVASAAERILATDTSNYYWGNTDGLMQYIADAKTLATAFQRGE